MENLPISMPPRSFRSRLQKMFYYLGSPGVAAAVGVCIGAFIFLGMFAVRYTQQEIWYRSAPKVADARIIGYDHNDKRGRSVYKVEYAAPEAGGQLKIGYMTANFVAESYLGKPIPIVLSGEDTVILDKPDSFYRLGWSFILFALWIAIPSFALKYFIEPRRKTLQLLEMGLGAMGKLEAVNTSVLSTHEAPKKIYNFQFEAFDGKQYEAKVSSRSGQWSESRPEALILYNMKNPSEQLVVAAMDSAPKISEEGVMTATFSEKALGMLAGTVLLLVAEIAFLWVILYRPF